MSSLIAGFQYDIFISYRQKDNKYDGWVSEFVDNLKKELESTFKEDITLYFDINPHDGLLETHDVDASLKEKLRCLVFIPIISRTYCDPKSFAWEHEFRTFIDQASQDKYGLKVKLPNGNVVNRILPVLIHDLDRNDKELCESILGGVLRGIEFIYKEAGVNRPLKPDDDTVINLNKTKYRNQVNKVALAIKEIFSGLSADSGILENKKSDVKQLIKALKTGNSGQELQRSEKMLPAKALAGVVLITGLIFAAIFAWPEFFKKNTIESLRSSGERISVAVMPFQNMTADTSWNVRQDWIQDILINSLSNSVELRIRQPENINNLIRNQGIINYVSLSPSIAGTIAKKLDAKVFILGNIKLAGNRLRLNAQLIDSKSENVFKSFQVEGYNVEEDIFQLIDSLSIQIKNFLIISKLKQEQSREILTFITTNSPEAFRYFINGRKSFYKQDYVAARDMFFHALAIDSSISIAYTFISTSFLNEGLYDQAKRWCLKAYNKREQMPLILNLLTNWLYATNFKTPHEEIIILKNILDIDDKSPVMHFLLGNAYMELKQYEKAVTEYEISVDIYKKWDLKTNWVYWLAYLGEAYHNIGKYNEEKKLYKEAEQKFPDNQEIIHRQAILALSEGKTKDIDYIEKYISIAKANSFPEASIMNRIAGIYSDAGILNKAEEFYRKALSLEPENPVRLNNLAWFLIEKDRNIEEGLDLIEKCLEIRPDEYYMIDTKGWGLFKQGRYNEALDLLEKSWNLKPVYDHDVFLHLEAAKKAVLIKR